MCRPHNNVGMTCSASNQNDQPFSVAWSGGRRTRRAMPTSSARGRELKAAEQGQFDITPNASDALGGKVASVGLGITATFSTASLEGGKFKLDRLHLSRRPDRAVGSKVRAAPRERWSRRAAANRSPRHMDREEEVVKADKGLWCPAEHDPRQYSKRRSSALAGLTQPPSRRACRACFMLRPCTSTSRVALYTAAP
jgi:hypothetical protein